MPTLMTTDEYLVPAAARYLKMQPDTLRRYAARGVIRVSRRLGAMLVFSREELDRFKVEKRDRGNPAWVKR